MNSPLNCVRDHRRIIPYLDKKEQTSISYSNIIKEKSEESERDLATCVCVPDGEVILGIDILHPTKVYGVLMVWTADFFIFQFYSKPKSSTS